MISLSIVKLFSLCNTDLNGIIKIINCLKLTDRFLKIRHSFAPNGSIKRQNVTLITTPTKKLKTV